MNYLEYSTSIIEYAYYIFEKLAINKLYEKIELYTVINIFTYCIFLIIKYLIFIVV